MIVEGLAVIGGLTLCAGLGYGGLVVAMWRSGRRAAGDCGADCDCEFLDPWRCERPLQIRRPRAQFLRGNMFDPHPKPSA